MGQLLSKAVLHGDILTVNGKDARLIRAYAFDPDHDYHRADIHYAFWLALASRYDFKPDDFGEHWRVIWRGEVQIAFWARPFSYHLLNGEEAPEDWPKIKECTWYAWIGLTENAALHAMRLTLGQRYQTLDIDGELERNGVSRLQRLEELLKQGPQAFVFRPQN